MSKLNWNELTIDAIKNDPNIATTIADEIESMSWATSKFSYLVGQGSDRGIKFIEKKKLGAFRPRLRPKLLGKGVRGNANLNTNLDRLEILTQTVHPVVFANAIESEISQYTEMKNINFVKEATDGLKTWAQETRDRAFSANLCNDFTNAVIADKDNGFKDTKNEKEVQSATRKIAQGDVCNVKMLERAIFMAKSGTDFKGKTAFPLKPIKTQMITINGMQVPHESYFIFLESHQAEQLRNDPEWREMQKFAENRGADNPLFTGCMGSIRGCPVIDMGTWSVESVGLPTSSVSDEEFTEGLLNLENVQRVTPPSFYKDAGAEISIGCLIGASALILAGNDSMKLIVDDTYDSGRKILVGIDKIQTIAKTRFAGGQTLSNELRSLANRDFAVIGLFSSKE